MSISMHSVDAGVTRLLVDGPMTIYEAARDKQDLLAALRARVPLAMDLSGVEEIDTAGVQLLVLATREAARNGVALTVVAASAAVAEALESYGLTGALAPAAGPLEGAPAERNSHEP